MLSRLSLLLGSILCVGVWACPGVLSKIGDHIELDSLGVKRAGHIAQLASRIGEVLSGDDSLERGLSALLDLDPQEALEIVVAYSEHDMQLRAALIHRLRWLGEWGRKEDLLAFLRQIPKADDPISVPHSQTLASKTSLQKWITPAVAHLRTAPNTFLDHILGEKSIHPQTGPVSSGGGHLLAGWESLAHKRIEAWPAEQRSKFDAVVSKLNMGGGDAAFLFDFLTEAGFDLSRRGWTKHFVYEQNLWGIEKKKGGVVCLWLPRPLFNGKSWRATLQSARFGRSPVGGKSVFPVSWSTRKIQDAALAILGNSKSYVLNAEVSDANPFFYVRGTYDGVTMDVGINGSRVETAFPAWRQQWPETIGDAYLEWWTEHGRAVELASTINLRKHAATDLRSPLQVAQLYLGFSDVGLPESDRDLLRKWLDPASLHENASARQARSYQSVTFSWLSRERVVQRIEGREGALFSKN